MWENSSLWERLGLWGTRTECSTWDTSATAARDACYNADLQARMQHGCIHATAPSELMQKLDWERFLSSPTQLKATKYIRFILLFLQQAGVSLHLPLPLETAEVNFGLEAQALRNQSLELQLHLHSLNQCLMCLNRLSLWTSAAPFLQWLLSVLHLTKGSLLRLGAHKGAHSSWSQHFQLHPKIPTALRAPIVVGVTTSSSWDSAFPSAPVLALHKQLTTWNRDTQN